jgi:hypothetical protein
VHVVVPVETAKWIERAIYVVDKSSAISKRADRAALVDDGAAIGQIHDHALLGSASRRAGCREMDWKSGKRLSERA